MVERNRPQALDALMAARKSKADKDDGDKIYAAVEADLNKRQDALVAADPTLATYEPCNGDSPSAMPRHDGHNDPMTFV